MVGTSVVAFSSTRLLPRQPTDVAQTATVRRSPALSSAIARALLQAASQSRPSPPHLGTRIDTWA